VSTQEPPVAYIGSTEKFFGAKTEKISIAILWTMFFTVSAVLYTVRPWNPGFLLYEGSIERVVGQLTIDFMLL
jgi:hypothetical protein